MTRLIDARAARFEQGVIAVLLLAAFVFRVELLVHVSAGVLLLGVLLDPRPGPIHAVFETQIAPRLRRPRPREPAPSRRFAAILEVAVLALAFLLFLADLEAPAWLLTLVVAGAAAVDCTTGVSAGTAVRRWLARRRV